MLKRAHYVRLKMPNNPKLTPEQRRKQNLLKIWGIQDGPHNPNFRNIIRNAVYEADAEKKKISKATPPKVDVDSITKSRMFLEKVREEKVEFKQLKFDFDKEQQ